MLKNSSPDANTWRLEAEGSSPTHCASLCGFFRMVNVEGFLLSSLPYSTSDETKQSGNGKLFPCSMRFILSRRHLIRARRLLAGSFFILCKFKEGRVSLKYVNKRPFFLVTIWRDRWVTKPQDKTKKAGSSFLSKLGGGGGGGVACERQTFLLAHRPWGTFQRRWVRRNVCRSQARGGEERGGKRARKGKVRVWVRVRVRRPPCYLGTEKRHLGLIVLFKLWLRNRYNTVAKSSVTHLKSIYQLLVFKYLGPPFLKKSPLKFQRGHIGPHRATSTIANPVSFLMQRMTKKTYE